MRAKTEEKDFSEFLLQIGNGTYPYFNYEDQEVVDLRPVLSQTMIL
jgi:hypothetical protein